MTEEKKERYEDRIRSEFCQMAVNYGVNAAVAQELASYLVVKMMSSWKNGLRFGREQAAKGQVQGATA